MLLNVEALYHYDEATKLPQVLFTAIDDDATGKLLCNVLVRGDFIDNNDLRFEITSTINGKFGHGWMNEWLYFAWMIGWIDFVHAIKPHTFNV